MNITNLWGREPALILAFFTAAIGFAVAFGLELSDLQQASIMGLVSAIIGVITRQRVTPV